MSKEIVMKKWAVKVKFLLAGMATICFMLACAEDAPITPRQLPPVPTSPWGGNY